MIDADLGLGGGDLRASERTFQLLYQVAGRAGRESRPGRVFIQTHLPEHPVMQALAAERQGRLPHGRARGAPRGCHAAFRPPRRPDRGRARCGAGEDPGPAPGPRRTGGEGALVLGPAPAPLALLRGRYRERLLVKAEPQLDLPAYLRRWLAAIKLPGAVQLQVDVDPYSFL